MKKKEFKKLYAQNFLSFGPQGIELDLTTFGNIILIKGLNLDVQALDITVDKQQVKTSSNGSGKSSIQEILCWTLFGKTIKNAKKIGINDVAHNKFKKNTVTRVEWDEFVVERGRGPNYVKLWESGVEITKGANTQKIIEEKLGLTYESFINICIFSDDNRSCFLEQDGPTKREIVEVLLSINEIKNWHKNAKDLLKEYKTQETTYSKEYDLLNKTKIDNENRLQQYESKEQSWKQTKLTDLKNLAKVFNDKKQALENLDVFSRIKEFDEAQIRIVEIQNNITELESSQNANTKELDILKTDLIKIEAVVKEFAAQVDKIKIELTSINKDAEKAKAEIQKLENKTTGVACKECFQQVPLDNYEQLLIEERDKYEKSKSELESGKLTARELLDKLNAEKKIQAEIEVKIQNANNTNKTIFENTRKLNGELVIKSKITKPSLDVEQEVLIQEIENLKNQIKKEKAEYESGNPYVEIIADIKVAIANSIKDCEEKVAQTESLRKEYPYINYFINAFGEDGIRKWIIDEIIPSLNSKIQYWLQFLMNGLIQLKFNNLLEEEIQQVSNDDNQFIYHAMSAGERRRLNLAISQAFSYIMSINTVCQPSLVFLDEVTTNIDPCGVQGIYNMICELSKEKQVFVTTHDKDLLDMLQGSKIINLQKKDGITTLI